MHIKRSLLGLVACVVCAASPLSASALTKGFEASSFHPAVDGGPYFTTYSTESLKQWQWVVGTMASYSSRPIRLRLNGQLRGIVDHTLTQDVHFAVGLVDQWLQFGLDVPVSWWISWKDPAVASPSSQNKMAFGDVRINFKSEFLKLSDHRVGIGLLPFVTIPSGKGKYFSGKGGVSGGGKLLLEFLPVDRWRIALNVGAMLRPKFQIYDVEKTNQLLYGMATAVDLTKHLSLAAEVAGKAKLSDLFGQKNETPVEADGGFKYAIAESGVTVSAGGGAGITRGSGTPNYRVFLGINYRSREKEKPAPAPVEEARPSLDAVRDAKIHFLSDNSEFATIQDAEKMIEVTNVLWHNPEAKVAIVGYADNQGSSSYNQKLSEKRAEKVQGYLVDHGIAADRLSVEARGEENPIGDNMTEAGRAENRRVEFRIE